MTHWKKLLDPGIYLGPADFESERRVKISRLVREKKPAREGEAEESGVMLYILDRNGAEFPRKLVVPKCVLYGLSLELGADVDKWPGQEVAFFATRCLSFGEVDDCVRPRLSSAHDAKVRSWLKRRKASPRVWIDGPTPAPPPAKASVPAPTGGGA